MPSRFLIKLISSFESLLEASSELLLDSASVTFGKPVVEAMSSIPVGMESNVIIVVEHTVNPRNIIKESVGR